MCRFSTNSSKNEEQFRCGSNDGRGLVRRLGDLTVKEKASSEDLVQSGYLGDDENSECGCVG